MNRSTCFLILNFQSRSHVYWVCCWLLSPTEPPEQLILPREGQHLGKNKMLVLQKGQCSAQILSHHVIPRYTLLESNQQLVSQVSIFIWGETWWDLGLWDEMGMQCGFIPYVVPTKPQSLSSTRDGKISSRLEPALGPWLMVIGDDVSCLNVWSVLYTCIAQAHGGYTFHFDLKLSIVELARVSCHKPYNVAAAKKGDRVTLARGSFIRS